MAEKPSSKDELDNRIEIVSVFNEDGKTFEELMNEILRQIVLK